MLGQKAQGIQAHTARSVDGQVDMASSGYIQAYIVTLSEDGNRIERTHESTEVEICKQMQNIASCLYILPFPYFLQCCRPLDAGSHHTIFECHLMILGISSLK